jgi:uroporphyrinogen decarboxylase
LARWKEESGISDLNPGEYFGFDCGFVTVPVEYGPCPAFPAEILEEDHDFVTSTDYRGLTVRNRRDGNSMPEFLDYPVKSTGDWTQYKEQHLAFELDVRLSKLEEFVRFHATVDAPVQVGEFPWGLFGTPRDLLGAEELLVGFYTQPELIRDMMETYTTLWLKLYSAIAAKLQIDHIHIWEDMSGRNGSLISMEMVEDFMMPCYDRIARFATENGIPLISVDSDGLVDQLVPVMMQHGINVFLPFEVQAGNDIREYRKRYPTLGIIGGLDKNVLSEHAAQGAMHRELDRAEAMLSAGGYIPGFDHLIPPNVPWRKWSWFVQSLSKLIGV